MKRWIAKLVVVLLLGAVVNVAVAWGCTWGASHQNSRFHPPTEEDYRWWYAHVPEGFPSVSPWEVNESHTFGLNSTVMFERMGSQTSSVSLVIRIRAGWPARALEGSKWLDSSKGGSRVIARHLMEVFDDRHPLPMFRIWPGVAINTVFYAAILWMLTLGPFTARRIIRHKRGHCIKCGYDLRGDFSAGSSECGWQRASET